MWPQGAIALTELGFRAKGLALGAAPRGLLLGGSSRDSLGSAKPNLGGVCMHKVGGVRASNRGVH